MGPADTRAVGLSLQGIVETALDVVRHDGVSQLTMRRLAGRLGVRAPTLYHHVASKAQLLDLLSAEAFRTLQRPTGAYDDVTSLAQWTAQLRSDATALRDFYRRHPGLAAVVVAGQARHETKHDDIQGEARAPEMDALVRLGVPAVAASESIRAMAWWTMAALAADTGTGRSADHFEVGLDLMLTGVGMRLSGRPGVTQSGRV